MIIESKRLILREWEYSDIDDLVEGLNNINVSKWMASIPFPYFENDALSFIRHAKQQDKDIIFIWQLYLKKIIRL